MLSEKSKRILDRDVRINDSIKVHSNDDLNFKCVVKYFEYIRDMNIYEMCCAYLLF